MPFLVRFPESYGIQSGQVIDKPVELMDLMPTFLDAAGVDIPVTVDGESLVPLMKDESSAWRDFVHGECCDVPSSNSGMQYVTDGKRKFAWFPGKDEELFFDLEEDPQEVHNLSNDPDRAIEVATWRGHLIAQLGDRPEGFTDGEKLIEQDGPTAPVLTRVIEDAQASEVIE